MKCSSKRGFTLVELLVVIAIIGILVALLLPAIQSARESSRRTSCNNNLKQLGLAVQNYHDTYESFPSGWLWTGGSSRETYAWSALILPYMEEGNLHEQLGVSNAFMYQILTDASTRAAAVQAAETVLPGFNCPSDTGSNTSKGHIHSNRHFGGGRGTRAAGLGNWRRLGTSNYMGVMGHRDAAGTNRNSGIFFGNSGFGFEGVFDGTSNTFMIGERDTFYCRSGAWVGIRNPAGSGSRGVYTSVGHSRPKLNQPTNVISWGNSRGCGEGFSSLHPGGAQFCLADGSVRFVSEDINHFWVGNGTNHHTNANNGTYQRLISRNDDLTVPNY